MLIPIAEVARCPLAGTVSAKRRCIAMAAPNGLERVVLDRDRRAEQRHDRIADELVDRPLVLEDTSVAAAR